MTRYGQEKFWSDFRVGLITFTGLVFLVLGVVFAGGDKGLLFQKTSLLHARLADVGGLKKGSSVTMGGMAVGRVTDITFVNGSKGNQIDVTLQVRSDVLNRIKADSIPTVRTQGMLGDRYLDVSMGTEDAGPLTDSTPLVGDAATDFDRALRQANDVMAETEELLKDFRKNPRKYIKFSLF